jgi:hypothetical protein
MKRKHKADFTISRFFCCGCGQEGIMIPRKVGNQRKKGHLKKIYCVRCGEFNHVEIQPSSSYTVENFKEEFNLGRFVNGERVPIAELDNCKEEKCDYCKNGKCWNANHSFNKCLKGER